MATRRSKRSHTDDELQDAIIDTKSLAATNPTKSHHLQASSNSSSSSSTTLLHQRRPLHDLTNKEKQQLQGVQKGKSKSSLVEEVVQEESHVKTRAQSRSTKVQEPSAKKQKHSSKKQHHAHHNAASPIQLDDEEEEDEDEEEQSEQEEDEEMHMMEDVEMKESSHYEGSVVAASASATAPVKSVVKFEDQPSWQQCLDDPCQEYADSIYQHLRTTEMQLHPDPLYMDNVQKDLTHAMRSILIDWLVEVAQEYHLKPQTLFLSVTYIDRFLSVAEIDRSKLQLVGVTAMLIAAKYWEIYPPAIDEFVYISDRTYEKDEVLKMENVMLTCLKFKLTSPTSWEFSRRFCRASNADKVTEFLVDYMLELMLQESPSLTFRPSIIAASALFLALHTQHMVPWSAKLEINSGIRVEELQSCVRIMHQLYVKTSVGQNTVKAVRAKYSEEAYLKVADIKPRNL